MFISPESISKANKQIISDLLPLIECEFHLSRLMSFQNTIKLHPMAMQRNVWKLALFSFSQLKFFQKPKEWQEGHTLYTGNQNYYPIKFASTKISSGRDPTHLVWAVVTLLPLRFIPAMRKPCHAIRPDHERDSYSCVYMTIEGYGLAYA
jgi:hypothetical protein